KRKMMTTFHRIDGGVVAIVKGAVDELMSKLSAETEEREQLEARVNEMASKGYRTLGYAIRRFDELPDDLNPGPIEDQLTFVGMVGMIDPPREEAKKSVAECRNAGIFPVMITGDHKLTARAIAQKLGIISSNTDEVIGGPELE